MAEYVTEQKKVLADFLRSHCDQSFTIEELMSAMREQYASALRIPGTSTVYRLMTRLVDEGSVKRFAKSGSRRFVYQSVTCTDCHSHLHLKCVDCGKLIHLDGQVSHALADTVRQCSDFSVNEEDTILFGRCATCKK